MKDLLQRAGDVERFVSRHVGPRPDDVREMLSVVGYKSLDALIAAAVPETIRSEEGLELPDAATEADALAELRAMGRKNKLFRSYIGMGYADCFTPPVILRNVLENPGWYTAYTPYQAEIAQGRLAALVDYQTMVTDLTGLDIANASMLDEATAAAEAMTMTLAATRPVERPVYLVDAACHPQTIAVLRTRAEARGLRIVVDDPDAFSFDDEVIGALVQYPATDGRIRDFRDLCARAHESGALVTAATDLLALVLLSAPGEWGADVAVGNSQRFGVPLGYGGPHAAFFATTEHLKRLVPGRIIGVTRDRSGRPAYRMALQTREQHIRREKATSNICTAQVLLAVMAGLFAVYHGPDGLRRIARRVHALTAILAAALQRLGYEIVHDAFFDTIAVDTDEQTAPRIHAAARDAGMNLRHLGDARIGITLDETTSLDDVTDIAGVFALDRSLAFTLKETVKSAKSAIPKGLARKRDFLTHPVFHRYHSETEMLRYLKTLENRDLSLAHAMIPLGSCTMKLNATTEMIPVTWPEFAGLHPFAPTDQAEGYIQLLRELEEQLLAITGYTKISMQPNAGSQGEFTGLLVIRAYHRARGETDRDVCLIPTSAHGTNPASAVMAGFRVVPVKADEQGNIDMEDLRAKAKTHRDRLGALMITYPSTHGVFEPTIRDICRIIHDHGGQVYLDGANLNALVGLSKPAALGADVCHLNLHKTFCIPHGGGGPGMGPIGVASHLAPFLPDHPVIPLGVEQSCGTVSAAPWGSPAILPISWAYIRTMGAQGLAEATKVAILNANYIARRLEGHYELLYAGREGLIAHECILDTRPFKGSAGVDVEDIAKRLIDYGFHAPTISWPVAGTMMIEPTESESKEELDRFCDAMIAIRDEIRAVEEGRADREDNPLKNAPHTLADVAADTWDHPYGREQAAFPSPQTRERKLWPAVGRVDAAYGDRHLVCTCPPVEELAEPVGAT